MDCHQKCSHTWLIVLGVLTPLIILVAACGTGATPTPQPVEGPVLLRWNVPVGDSVGYTVSMSAIPPLSGNVVEFDIGALAEGQELPTFDFPDSASLIMVLQGLEDGGISVNHAPTGVSFPMASDPSITEVLRTFVEGLQGTMQIVAEISENGAIASLYTSRDERNALAILLGLPEEPVKVGDTWTIDVDLVALEEGALLEDTLETSEINQVKLVSLVRLNDGETIATIEYAIEGSVSGELATPIGEGPTAFSATIGFVGSGEFLVDQGTWKRLTGRMHTRSSGVLTLISQQYLSMELLDEVPEALASQVQPPRSQLYMDLLRLVPSTPQTLAGIWVSDYSVAREVFNVPAPGDDEGEDALEGHITAISSASSQVDAGFLARGPFISGYSAYTTETLGMRRYLGFDFRDVDQSLMTGIPPETIEILRGRFEPGKEQGLLAACLECPEHELVEYKGTTYNSWGEDLKQDLRQRFALPFLDELGRAGRIAIQDEYVFRTKETASMEAIIESGQAQETSLADLPEYQILAGVLSDLSPYSAYLSASPKSMERYLPLAGRTNLSSEQIAELKDEAEFRFLLRPFQVWAAAAGIDEQGPYMVVLLVHASEEAANLNVSLLGQRIDEIQSFRDRTPWKELFTERQISAEAKLLVAKLRGPGIGSWINPLFSPETLLIHE